MFRAWCAAEGAEVLLTSRRITSIHRRPGEVWVAFTCWCGHAGLTVDRTDDLRSGPLPLPCPPRPDRPEPALQ